MGRFAFTTLKVAVRGQSPSTRTRTRRHTRLSLLLNSSHSQPPDDAAMHGSRAHLPLQPPSPSCTARIVIVFPFNTHTHTHAYTRPSLFPPSPFVCSSAPARFLFCTFPFFCFFTFTAAAAVFGRLLLDDLTHFRGRADAGAGMCLSLLLLCSSDNMCWKPVPSLDRRIYPQRPPCPPQRHRSEDARASASRVDPGHHRDPKAPHGGRANRPRRHTRHSAPTHAQLQRVTRG